MKKERKYDKSFPKEMYKFFISSAVDGTAPSFDKYARSIGVTLETLIGYRKHREFEKSWRECIEIRRDYLTDSALTRRYDPSFVKFLLGAEFGVGNDDNLPESDISVSIKVVDS